MSILDKGYIALSNRVHQEVDTFKSDEQGVSGIVATVILVLLAVALAVIFWDKIKTFVEENLWKKVEDSANGLP